MSIINNGLLLASEAAGAGGYQVSRSLRFNSSDSAYLSRTPASAGNRKTWTWAGWVKRSGLGGLTDTIMDARTGSNESPLCFNESVEDTLSLYEYNGGYIWQLRTTQVFRDASAWYHIVAAVDTTQATASNRVKLYVNNVQVTALAVASYPSQNHDTFWNTTNPHVIGQKALLSGSFFDGYLADVHFIDGQALTPSSFTEVSATTGQLIPKAYTGSYGTNGFRLPFSDNSGTTSTTLGKDAAGSNDWTPNNFSVASGSGNDSLVDTPTSYGTDTGAGGEVRGNYCTLNPLDKGGGASAVNGNLDLSLSSPGSIRSTFGLSSGKWYWETTLGASSFTAGITKAGTALSAYLGSQANEWSYGQDGRKYTGASGSSYGATFTTGDVIGVAFDADNGTLTFYKNGSSQGTAFTGLTSGPYFPAVGDNSATSGHACNFGQRPFAYTAPSGFKALCDTNLPAPVVAKPNTVMDVIRYTGTGANATIPNVNTVPTSIDFTPDLVWIKGRSGATDHALYDSVRDVQKDLVSNSTAAETTQSTGLTAFGTNTFDIGTLAKLNTSSSTYVGWCWDAGTSTVSNTQGSITSSVRANASAGFSVVTVSPGSSTQVTIGHGLGVAPGFIIMKQRNSAGSWHVWHSSFTTSEYLFLNSTAAKATSTNLWGTSLPTSTVFGFNIAAGDWVGYCWAPVAGYSSFGSYTGNGSADGPFVFTGHRPRWIMIKRTDATQNWYIFDAVRNTYNAAGLILEANLSDAEFNYPQLDILSNGFKLRGTDAGWNASGGTYIYMALAESPFQYARAR